MVAAGAGLPRPDICGEPPTVPGCGRDDEPPGTLASKVARRVEAEVVRRGWPIGQSLGSEPELCDRFGVSRAVLREAVRLVEHHQVARMRRGPHGGLIVSAPDAGPATRAMVIYLEFVGTSVADLLEARLLMEPLAAALSAERLNEHGIATLRHALDSERERHGEPGIWSLDPLHVMLGQLSGNAVLRLFIDVLTRLTTRYAHTSRTTPKATVVAAKADAHRKHLEIVEAVIAGDRARAQTLVVAHVSEIASWLEAHRVRRPAKSGRGRQAMVEGPRAKLAEVTAARIHNDIADLGWPIGTVLGSETDLLARYGVSRAVLREAVRLLEYHAVARMRRGPGGGLVVARPEPQATIETMALYLEFQKVTVDNLRLVRDTIELGTTARVVARRNDPQVAERLDAAVRWVVEGPSDDPSRSDRFHTELADVAGNPVLTLFLRIITQLWWRHSGGQERPPPITAPAEVAHIHQRILDAVLDGDESLAQHRMRRHLAALTPWWH